MAKKLVNFSFDGHSPKAVARAEKDAAKAITGISKETAQNVRTLIATSIREGIPPYDAARTIKSLIGLSAQQGQAAFKFRSQLIDNGLTLEKVDAQVERYANKLLNARAATIARTEIMSALNDGHNDAFQEAQDEGYLSENATKEWVTTDDELLCPDCEEMDGKTVPVGEDFQDGDPPLHPNCRCTTVIGTP